MLCPGRLCRGRRTIAMRRLEASVRSFIALAVLAIGCSGGAPAPTTPPPPPPPPPTPAAAAPSPIAAAPAAAPSASPVSEDVYDQDDPVARSRLLLTRRCGGISRYAAIAAVPADQPSMYRVLAIIDGSDPEPHQGNSDLRLVETYATAGSPVHVLEEADLDGDEDTDLLVAPSESGCGSAGECVYGVWLRCGDDFVDVAPMYALDLEVVRGSSGRPRVVATHAQEGVVFEVQMAVLTGETQTTIRIPRVAIDRRR